MEVRTAEQEDSKPVGVIDIGSNTLKGLLAVRRADGEIVARRRDTAEVRISAGSWAGKRMLSEEGMAAALEAITGFLVKFREAGAEAIRIVATSAVRDAANGAVFRDRVAAATGIAVEILSGEREALLICRGMLCDPGLRSRRSFDLFDLGGGSLEVIQFRDGEIRKAVSLPLGCVRLMERYHRAPSEPLTQTETEAVAAEVRRQFAGASLEFEADTERVCVGTGGTITTIRGILGGEQGKDIHHVAPRIALAEIERLLQRIGGMQLEERRTVPRLPPGRADVFPVALATVLEAGRLSGAESFRHSFHNLRFGLAAEMLGASS